MCIIIVIAIIVGNIITQNYTVKSIGILSEELEELKKDVIEAEENGEEEVNENIKNKKEEIKNGGILENEQKEDGKVEQRYWIDLE